MSDDDTQSMGGESPSWSGSSAPGGTIGRFVVLGSLGSGGMGVVLSAYDPALDRRVALKLLRPDVWSRDGRARIEREAQAMARVQHPNVATVYEVGSVGEQAFVAMELVEGRTLKSWLGASERPWQEVVAMLAAAGRGLAAVHAAGIVHRDFKPDNVLVGGDERPRVSDFGLVSLAPRPAEPGAPSLSTSFAGTPGYMSPEQLRGTPSDARSDQFSFCVTLYEALWGERPFPDDAAADARRAPARPPSQRKVPAWLFSVVARGLTQNPDERWPSMAALLHALSHDPAASRRRWLGRIGAAALLLLALLAFELARVQRVKSCAGFDGRLAGVWDAKQKHRIEVAFVGSGVPYARELWQRSSALLDDYARRFVATSEEACRATHVEGRQSEALLDLRMACLDRRRATLRELGELWASEKLTAKSLEGAPAAAASLPRIEDCSDTGALSSPLPPPRDPASQKRIAALRGKLDRIHALLATSDWGEARRSAEAVQTEAAALAYPPLEAEAKWLLGVSLDRMAQPGGETILEDAARLASLAHDDRLAARAMITLVSLLSNANAQFEKALVVSQVAEAQVARAGDTPELRGLLLSERGNALAKAGRAHDARPLLVDAQRLLASSLGETAPETILVEEHLASAIDDEGDYAGARAAYNQLIEAARRANGLDSPREAQLLVLLGFTEQTDGHYAESEKLLRRALEIDMRRLGPENERVAEALDYLGNSLYFEDRLDEAAALVERSLQMYRRIDGNEHPWTATVLNDLGTIRTSQGRTADAVSLTKEAVGIALRTMGPDHPSYGAMLDNYGMALSQTNDYAGARAAFQRSFEVTLRSRGADHPNTWDKLVSRATLDAHNGHCAEARDDLDRAREGMERTLGSNHPRIGYPLAEEGICDLLLGRTADALRELERAVAIIEKSDDHSNLGDRRFALARALDKSGQHARALKEAKQAERELAEEGPTLAEQLAKLRAWLRSRG